MYARTPDKLNTKRGPRDLSSLQPSSHEKRYEAVSQKGYFKSTEPQRDAESKSKAKKRCKLAAADSWSEYLDWKDKHVSDDGITMSIDLGAKLRKSSSSLVNGMAKCRRFAVQYFFVQYYGAAPEEAWGDFDERRNVPTLIMMHVAAPEGSYASVVEVLRQILAAGDAGEAYDPSKTIREGRGAICKIKDLTPQAEVVYRTMESGLSLGKTLVLLNRYRRRKGLDPCSYGCLQHFVATSEVMIMEARTTRKAGSTDEESGWAQGRESFALQVKRQINKADRIHAGGEDYIESEDGPQPQAVLERPIYLNHGGFAVMDQVANS